jgi:V/A-type H+-transporting ATPase subunit D
MIGAATRSRLYELRRARSGAVRSADLLDRKRTVLLRELNRRERERRRLARLVELSYGEAHRRLAVARVDLGIEAVEAAALAQPRAYTLESHDSPMMGVRIPRLIVKTEPYRAHYGAAATSESLDGCGAAFTALLPDLIALAQEQIAIERLTLAVRKTNRLLNALQKVVLPRYEREIRLIVEGIEEEERDEGVRRMRAFAG